MFADVLGNPTEFSLNGGHAHNLAGADHLLTDQDADTLIADKAFDADGHVIEPMIAAGESVVILSEANCKFVHNYGRGLSKARHTIENLSRKSSNSVLFSHDTTRPPGTFLELFILLRLPFGSIDETHWPGDEKRGNSWGAVQDFFRGFIKLFPLPS